MKAHAHYKCFVGHVSALYNKNRYPTRFRSAQKRNPKFVVLRSEFQISGKTTLPSINKFIIIIHIISRQHTFSSNFTKHLPSYWQYFCLRLACSCVRYSWVHGSMFSNLSPPQALCRCDIICLLDNSRVRGKNVIRKIANMISLILKKLTQTNETWWNKLLSIEELANFKAFPHTILGNLFLANVLSQT